MYRQYLKMVNSHDLVVVKHEDTEDRVIVATEKGNSRKEKSLKSATLFATQLTFSLFCLSDVFR